MQAGLLNFDGQQSGSCEIGATFKRIFNLKNKETQNRFILTTGYTAKMQVRSTYAKPVVFELSTENNRITIDRNSNIVLYISATDTATIKAGKYMYDLFIISPTGETSKILTGRFVVLDRITI